jgi:hypothetical protein
MSLALQPLTPGDGWEIKKLGILASVAKPLPVFLVLTLIKRKGEKPPEKTDDGD